MKLSKDLLNSLEECKSIFENTEKKEQVLAILSVIKRPIDILALKRHVDNNIYDNTTFNDTEKESLRAFVSIYHQIVKLADEKLSLYDFSGLDDEKAYYSIPYYNCLAYILYGKKSPSIHDVFKNLIEIKTTLEQTINYQAIKQRYADFYLSVLNLDSSLQNVKGLDTFAGTDKQTTQITQFYNLVKILKTFKTKNQTTFSVGYDAVAQLKLSQNELSEADTQKKVQRKIIDILIDKYVAKQTNPECYLQLEGSLNRYMKDIINCRLLLQSENLSEPDKQKVQHFKERAENRLAFHIEHGRDKISTGFFSKYWTLQKEVQNITSSNNTPTPGQ